MTNCFVSYQSRSDKSPPRIGTAWEPGETAESYACVMPDAEVTQLLDQCGLLGTGRLVTAGNMVVITLTDADRVVGVRVPSPDLSGRGLGADQWELANAASANGWLRPSLVQRLKRSLGF